MKEISKEEDTKEHQRKLPGWIICSILLLSILISGLIICTFILSENKYIITESIIILICLLVILILSNSFDYIHFGKYFELSKRVKEGNEKITQLKESSDALYAQFVNMSFQNTQAGTVNNYYQLKETDPITQQKEQEEEQKNNDVDKFNKRFNIRLFQNLILDKFSGTALKDKLKKSMSLVEEATQPIDQISIREVSFDALLEENNKLLFIDVMKGQAYSFYYDRVYVKLNKILCYTRTTKKKAQLLLLIPKELNAEKENRDSFFLKNFAPAIQNNLLRIEYVEYSMPEYDSCFVEKK